MHHAIKLRHLRLFLQMADSGSLSAAGRALGLTQPAMSKSLGELEGLLGGPLFLRQGRRLVLTRHGETVQARAREAIASLDAAALAFRPGGEGGALAVGVLPTVSTRFFPAVVGQFLAHRPAVTLSVETGPHPYLLRKLRDRDIDLMVGRMPRSGELAGLEFEFLYEEPIVAVVRAGHPLRRADLAEVLSRAPLILPTRDAIIRRTVDDYLAALGLRGLKAAVETSTLALGRGILLGTDAVWFISRGVVADEIDRGLLTPLGLGAGYLSGAVGLTTVSGAIPAAALAHLSDLIRRSAPPDC